MSRGWEILWTLSKIHQLILARHSFQHRNDLWSFLAGVSEALFYTGCDTPLQGPSLGRPIFGASNHGYFSLFAFYVDFWLLV